MTTDIALQLKISDRVAEYEKKKAAIPAQLKAFEKAGTDLEFACTIGGTYGQVRLDTGRIHDRDMFTCLLKSAWFNIHSALNLKTLMSAKDLKSFDQAMNDPPEFNMENIRATFGDYILDPWGNILRGLAEVFSELDQSYKSHEKVKIGVKGLPKRIIISGFGSYSYWGWERLADVVNALAAYQGKPLVSHWDLEREHKEKGSQAFSDRGLELKKFLNGNGHLIFTPDTLTDINKALAEYYGDVLADSHEAKPEKRQQSTAVSKDLQYYPTPMAVVKNVLGELSIGEGEIVLEPSCGCGRFMDGIARKFPQARCRGIEVDAARAEEARAKGHKVLTANFLETIPSEQCDHVVMNPPFYGKHYAKHIEHALKYLKPGGRLTAILPITARTDHGLVDSMGYKTRWRDLPFGSFRESGTNIHTTVLTIIK